MKTTIFSVLMFFFSCQVISQWVQTTSTPQGSGITGMALNVYGDLFVTTGSVSGGQQGGVRGSVDGGQNWVNYVDCYIARTLTSSRQKILYASIWYYPTVNEGIYRSFGGNGWIPLYNFPSSGNNVFSLLSPNDTFIYAGTRTGILRSTNYGVNFSYSNNGMAANSWVWCIAIDSSGNLAAATSNGLFISTNQGDLWYYSSGLPAGDTITSLCFYRASTDNGFTEKLICGTDDGNILTSSSSGGYAGLVVSFLLGANVKVETISRTHVTIEELYHFYVAASPKNPSQPGGGIYKSTNEGQTFTILNNGLPQNPIASKIINGVKIDTNFSTIHIGLFGNGNNGAKVYTQDFMIGIQQISNEVPKGFSLLQNFPNPFNPLTNIQFSVPKSSYVRLIIYDMLGREVERLVNENLKAGIYKTDWNASSFSSGVYFYKLETEGFTETKKMILIK